LSLNQTAYKRGARKSTWSCGSTLVPAGHPRVLPPCHKHSKFLEALEVKRDHEDASLLSSGTGSAFSYPRKPATSSRAFHAEISRRRPISGMPAFRGTYKLLLFLEVLRKGPAVARLYLFVFVPPTPRKPALSKTEFFSRSSTRSARSRENLLSFARRWPSIDRRLFQAAGPAGRGHAFWASVFFGCAAACPLRCARNCVLTWALVLLGPSIKPLSFAGRA